jgi:hypothetical protein
VLTRQQHKVQVTSSPETDANGDMQMWEAVDGGTG